MPSGVSLRAGVRRKQAVSGPLFTENFAGSDNTNINGKTTTTGGKVWAVRAGDAGVTPTIQNNKAGVGAGGNGGISYLLIDTGVTSGYLQATSHLNVGVTNDYNSFVVRSDGTNNNSLYFFHQLGQNFLIIERTGGSNTLIQDTGVACAPDAVIQIHVTSTHVSFLVNGVSVYELNSTNNAGLTQVGFGMATNVNLGASVDDISFGATAPVVTPLFVGQVAPTSGALNAYGPESEGMTIKTGAAPRTFSTIRVLFNLAGTTGIVHAGIAPGDASGPADAESRSIVQGSLAMPAGSGLTYVDFPVTPTTLAANTEYLFYMRGLTDHPTIAQGVGAVYGGDLVAPSTRRLYYNNNFAGGWGGDQGSASLDYCFNVELLA